MTKSELRKKYKQKRKALSTVEIYQFSIDIANNTLDLPIWDFSLYHLFLSIVKQNEVNTDFLLNIIQGKDKNVVLSKSNLETRGMQHFLLTDTTAIKTNDWGIPEPIDGIEVTASKIDVVFVPLLAFDKNGNRVGYGKGFYDKFLSECRPNVMKIGLTFFQAENKITDSTAQDIPLDYCVTPDKIYKF